MQHATADSRTWGGPKCVAWVSFVLRCLLLHVDTGSGAWASASVAQTLNPETCRPLWMPLRRRRATGRRAWPATWPPRAAPCPLTCLPLRQVRRRLLIA